MESKKDWLIRTEGCPTGTLGSNFSEVGGDEPDKAARRNGTIQECFRDQVPETKKEAQSGTFKEMRHASQPRAQEQERFDLPKKEANSSDAESDFCDGTDASCTPERMDYHNVQGKRKRCLCCPD